jgi:protein TonB
MGSGGGTASRPPLVRLSGDEPRYPTLARRRAVEGAVKIRFVVHATGRVEDAIVVQARPAGIFDAAALAAVRTWRFSPHDFPTAIEGEVDVVFRLE